MRYVAAYLLATLGGNGNPSEKDIKKILSSVGIDADDERMKKVVSEFGGKNVDDLISAGLSKLCSVPSGGAVSAAGSAPAPAAGGGAAPAAEKKEEVKEESEESDEDMGFGLFD
ncbi:large ribosomal subunit protein P2-like isoform X2 [Hyperolius riggenbachi]